MVAEHRSRIRRAVVWAHRWFGLTLGLLLVVVAVSGSLLLFQSHFFKWAHGDMLPNGLSRNVGSIDKWVENGRAAVPDLEGPRFIWAPHVAHNVTDAGMMIFPGHDTGLTAVLVAPGTGKVLGVVSVDQSPAYAPLLFHFNLRAGRFGELLVGVMALGALITLPVGLYLWWPSLVRVPRKLSPRPWTLTFTRARGLHDWVGAWSVIALIPLIATGLAMLHPDWVAPAVSAIAGRSEQASQHRTDNCTGPITFDTAIERSRKLAPENRFVSMALNHEIPGGNAWEISLRPEGSTALIDETHVMADLECGSARIELTPTDRTARDTLQMWIIGLHNGTAFGSAGQLLIALAGIAPLVLFWSGMRMWLRRGRWLEPRPKPRRADA